MFTLYYNVVAWGISCFEDASTISIMFTIFTSDNLSVIFSVIVDCTFGGSGSDKLCCLFEINLELFRMSRRSLAKDKSNQREKK